MQSSHEMIEVITQKIQKVLPTRYESFNLHEPCFDNAEESRVLDCIKTNWVSYQGKYVTEFETRLSEILGVKHVLAVTSGTVALYVALKTLGITGADEVIIPSLTFVATANAVHQAGATAHFVDADYETLGIDAKKLDAYLSGPTFENSASGLINTATGKRIKAIIPVHIFGHPAAMEPLLEIAQKYNLLVIEDCAESLGSHYNGRSLGAFSNAAILSFNGNKIITTGGGGAVATNDDNLAATIRHLTTTAKLAHPYEFEHDSIAYNFRMPNLNAALGVGQLEKITHYIENKRHLANKYIEAFSEVDGVKVIQEPKGARSNYWLNAIMLDSSLSPIKNELIQHLHANKIAVRPLWKPLHTLKMYQGNPRMSELSVTEDLYQRTICLPSSPFLYE